MNTQSYNNSCKYLLSYNSFFLLKSQKDQLNNNVNV